MDETDPIWQAIDLGGGQTCDVNGVVREVKRAGYVIVERRLLQDALEKLRLYRSAHAGFYLGGVEYAALVKRITSALTAS